MDLRGLCAKDLMQAGVAVVPETMRLSEAARTMRERGVSSLVVDRTDASDAFGIVTRKDVVDALLSEPFGGVPQTVDEVMTKPVFTAPPDLSIDHCLRMMKMAGIRRIPIVEAGALTGILSNTDIFNWIAEHLD